MASNSSPKIIEEVADLDVFFLRTVLQSPGISSFDTVRIGTGQVGEVYRIYLTYPSDPQPTILPSPATAILKMASKDARSRSSGLSLGIYERETRFYASHLATKKGVSRASRRLGQSIPRCHHAAFDPATGAFTLVLQDAGGAPGDELVGATREQARAAMRELGRLHSALDGGESAEAEGWRRLSSGGRTTTVTGEYLRQLLAGFAVRYGDRVDPGHMEICERFVASYDGYAAVVAVPGRCVVGVYHGDYRLDNMLFSRDKDNNDKNEDLKLTVVDWQLINIGPLFIDVAYFLGGSLKVEDRRAWTDELLQIYSASLATASGNPITMSPEACKEELRLQAFTGVTMAIVSSMMVGQTARGDDMFMAMLARGCEQVKDLGALDLLPPPPPPTDGDTFTPLRPCPEDERAHSPGPERDWNESWYFDFVDSAQGLAGWVRLGTTPNLGRGWYLVGLARDGQQQQQQQQQPTTLMIRDFDAPALDRGHPLLRLKTSAVEATHEVLEPLRRFRVALRGTAEVFQKAADSLRGGKAERECRVEMDLVYETDGVPYRYRLATRYEIPCKVTGTVRVGDDDDDDDGVLLRVEGVPGQRDHSFGVRDWWAMDWVWSAIHLEDDDDDDDGIGGKQQHVHATELRLFAVQGGTTTTMSMGYVQQQQSNESSLEIETVVSSERVDGDGLVEEADMMITARGGGHEGEGGGGGMRIRIKPVGHTPLRLVSDDGRVSVFDRSWVKVSLADGRVGTGWVEWNRNERSSG